MKKIFGSGIPPGAVELYYMVKKLSPAQKKGTKDALVKEGLVVGSGQAKRGAAGDQVGGFLGMLASLGIPPAIALVRKVIGEGVHIQPKGHGLHVKRAAGMQINPPPRFARLASPPQVFGSWAKKKKKFVDVPLSNFDLWEWCGRLNIPLKGIFARNEKMGKKSLPMYYEFR